MTASKYDLNLQSALDEYEVLDVADADVLITVAHIRGHSFAHQPDKRLTFW